MPRDFFRPGRSPVHAVRGACATSHPLASAEALTALRAGGSAADAAIAAVAVQCVVDPHMTGIGGDCFALVRSPSGETTALDGGGWSAAGADAATLRAEGVLELSETSPLAATVPGAIAAWRRLHRRHGRLPWRGLFQSAIAFARDGFPVSPRVAADWRRHADRLRHDDDARAAFLPDGEPPAVGTRFRLPALAETLRRIADDGGDSFYRGDIAAAIIAKLRRLGAPHDAADFADYDARWRRPMAVGFRRWRVWECPPPGQGVVALLMLAMLDQDRPRPFDGQRLRRFADITDIAYRWRDANLGDAPDALDNAEAAIAAIVENGASGDPVEDGDADATAPVAHKDTVCLSVMDSGGMTVSLINSLFHPFGGGLCVPECGILLHNRGLSFSLKEGNPNALAPRKRPLHTIIPAIAEGPGGETLSFGVMGGHYQAAGHAWFLSRLLDDGDDLQQALDAPRFFNYPDNTLLAEPTLPPELVAELAAGGRAPRACEEPLGGGQAVLRDANGMFVAASDSRKDGLALGF